MVEPLIRTPDQRLRVFVSSTLQELAEERATVREAVLALRLAPVMFELGARPHAPRDLYRAYLAQSHMFVGIYWQSYGWVAPGKEISGLEDEFRLSEGLPRLLYVKSPAPEREPRLAAMLERIKEEGLVSYKRFSSAAELADLVADDLALLLSEGFETLGHARAAAASSTASSDGGAGTPGAGPVSSLPLPPTPLVGREKELAELKELLIQEGVALVCLTGPGGTGKTRLALEAARALVGRFADGAAFVDLAPVSDPALVAGTLASALGIPHTPGWSVQQALLAFLADRQLLLLLDNFEQVVGAAPLVAEILRTAPRLTVLVTSRTPLRLRGEHERPVPPLEVPPAGTRVGPADVRRLAALRLFRERAREVRPDFEITDDNVEAVAEVARRLDGLPLALELAAARSRLLAPGALLSRLERGLDSLGSGLRDLPERQQTLRATIGWSEQLLGEDARLLLRRLSVFNGGWTLEAAEDVCGGGDGVSSIDVLAATDALLEASLVGRADVPLGEPRFYMLQTVREYARERLAVAGPEAAELRRRHADWFMRMAEIAGEEIRSPRRLEWLERLDADFENLRALLAWSVSSEGDPAWGVEFTWRLAFYWESRSFAEEGTRWLEALDARLASAGEAPGGPRRAKLMTMLGGLAWMQSDIPRALESFRVGVEGVRRSGDPASLAYALTYFGQTLASTIDPPGGLSALDEAVTLFDAVGDHWGAAFAQYWRSVALGALGDPTGAEQASDESLSGFRRTGDLWGEHMAVFMRGWLNVAQGDLPAALARVEESAGLARSLRDQWGFSWIIAGYGMILLLNRDPLSAEPLFLEALVRAREFGNRNAFVASLTGLGGTALACAPCDAGPTPAPRRAARLLGAAARQREGGYIRPWPLPDPLEQLDEAARQALGDELFQEEFAAGRAMTTSEALGFALANRGDDRG